MNKFYLVPSVAGALGKNKWCIDAPIFILKLLKEKSIIFSLHKSDIEEIHKEIFCAAINIFQESKKNKCIFLGGTHDITFPLFKAFKQKHKSAKLIIFDAHVDSDEGVSVATHEDFVKALVSQGIIKASDIIIIGVRKIYPSEKRFVKKSGVVIIGEDDVHDDINAVKNRIASFIGNGKDLYVSFDVDVLNGGIMQATHYHPLDGLSKKEFLFLASSLIKKAMAVDVVEFNPAKIKLREDKLLKELFSSFFRRI